MHAQSTVTDTSAILALIQAVARLELEEGYASPARAPLEDLIEHARPHAEELDGLTDGLTPLVGELAGEFTAAVLDRRSTPGSRSERAKRLPERRRLG